MNAWVLQIARQYPFQLNFYVGLHKSLVEMGIGVLSVKPMHSLEDYFLQITSTPKYV